MDRDHYISEAERQLGDFTYYTLLNHNSTPEFAQEMSEAINEMHDEGHISEKNRNYLLADQPKAGRFYLLSKIHKAGNPGRPMVSANGHSTEKISEFVDLHLQPHVQNLPSYLKDTTEFLRKQDAQAPFHPKPSLSLPSITIFHIKMASRHARRFGRKEKSRTHLHRLWSNF